MSNRTHRFNIGHITCIAINDGTRTITEFEQLHGIYSDLPEDELRAAFEALTEQEREFCYNPLLIDTGQERILVDTGHGPASEQHAYLLECMEQEGYTPHDVDVVFISHAHGDHIGGVSDGEGKLVFPNARYIIGEREWQFWTQEAASPQYAEDYLAFLRSKLKILESNLTLVSPDEEIAAGVRTVNAFGHTPGHLGLMVEAEGERLLHVVDTAHTLLQLKNPSWSPRFDSLKDVSPLTRRRLLQLAADENLLTYFFHLPFPALGHVSVDGDGFAWQPIK